MSVTTSITDPHSDICTTSFSSRTLVDVPIRNDSMQWRFVVRGLGASAGIGALLLFANLVGGPFGLTFPIMGIGFAIGIPGLLLALIDIRNRLRNRLIECLQLHPPPKEIAAVVAPCRDGAGRVLRGVDLLVREAPRYGYAGTVFRFGARRGESGIVPLDVAIEPIPVDERSAGFVALTAARGVNSTRSKEQKQSVQRDSAWRRYFIRHWVNIALFAVVGVLMLVTTPSARSYVPSVILLISLIPFEMLQRRGTCLIVNAGLLTRDRAAWRYFKAESCVLTIQPLSPGQYALCVSDGNTHATRVLTETEILVVLRAWLSPLPPPDVDRLSDLNM